jgi:hypothetical protein
MYLNERKRTARRFLSAVLAAGLVAALPGAAVAAPAGKAHHPHAKSAGSDAAPTLPSIVRVRIDRGTASLARAADYVDRDMPDKAVASLLNARRNMYAAWRGATYYVDHAPPPVAEAGRVHRKKARTSGAPAGAGTAYADAPTTVVAAINFQHTVATAAYGLLDGAKGALRDSVSTTIFAALDRRDQAINYVHNLPVPPPAGDARVHARASGAPVAAGYDAQMQGLIPDLDDELMQIEGLVSGGALTPGEKRILNQADFQVFRTERTINTYWPPVVGD